MSTRVYSIYDVKSGMYGPVMTFCNDNTAIRSFQEMLTSGDRQSLLALYPADYILFCLGIYHQDTGVIESLPAPMNIMSGMQAFTQACQEAEARRERQKRLDGINSDTVRKINNDYQKCAVENSQSRVEGETLPHQVTASDVLPEDPGES